MKPMTDLEYVDNEGLLCPYCGHDEVTGDSPQVDGMMVTLDVTCESGECRKQWSDRYALAGYDAPEKNASEDYDGLTCYPSLYSFAKRLNEAWEENEGLDWQEAEDLVSMLRKTETDNGAASELEVLRSEILAYCDDNEDWDSGEVARWPNLIMIALDYNSAGLMKENIDDGCQVFDLRLSGKKEWVASFNQENLAIVFIGLYQ